MSKPKLSDFAKLLRDFLKEHKIGQVEFAKRAKISQATVSKIINKGFDPRYSHYLRMMQVISNEQKNK